MGLYIFANNTKFKGIYKQKFLVNVINILIRYRNEVLDFMNAFIKKHQYNYIKKCLTDLSNALGSSVDKNVIEATKAYIQNKILNNFNDLSEEEKLLLDITQIKDQMQINKLIADLNKYVYGMQSVTSSEISKLFKKEKRLKVPDFDFQSSKKVYLGWIDQGTNKLFVAYNMDGKLVGMACRLPNSSSNNSQVCTLCNRIGKDNEVAFVSPICKTDKAGEGAYKSIGFNICLDSERCNERITSVEKLESLLKEVNNIKE